MCHNDTKFLKLKKIFPYGNIKNMKCLIVEDDKDFCEILITYLSKFTPLIFCCSSIKEAILIIEREKPELILLDIELKDNVLGIEILKDIIKYPQDTIVITGHIKYKEKLLKLYEEGLICDFYIKPLDFGVFFHRLNLIYEKQKIKKELNIISENYGIVGTSKAVLDIIEKIEIVGKTNLNVLIEGETGVGKELVARAIHEISQRKGNFVHLNCAAIPESMAEAELFGVKKGAATDVSERKGKILSANNGTLFLDEISSLPFSIQGKFLNVIESKKFYQVGGDEEIFSDFRLISASNLNLYEEVKEKRFREDLYFRISSFKIYIPPLRERKEDIPILSRNVIKNLSKIYGKEKIITDDALEILQSMEFKGNVRELQALLENVYFFDNDNKINFKDLFEIIKPNLASFPVSLQSNLKPIFPLNLKNYIEKIEKEIIEKALIEAKGNINKVSQMISIPRKTLYRKIKKYNLKGDKKNKNS